MIPTRGDLASMLALCGWPGLRIGPLLVQGEDAWERALPLLVPNDRLEVAAELGREALPKATAPHKAQLFDVPRPLEPAEERRLRIERALVYFGDFGLFDTVVEAVLQLPPVVGTEVLTKSMVAVVGRSTRGWTGPAFPVERAPILLDGSQPNEVVRRVCLHESAHRWVSRGEPATLMTSTAQHFRETIGPDAEDFNERRNAEERTVRLLTVAWLCGAAR